MVERMIRTEGLVAAGWKVGLRYMYHRDGALVWVPNSRYVGRGNGWVEGMRDAG